MFDPILEFVATILDFFYTLIPDYAVAIILLTCLVMIVTTPLTLKGTRGMIKMQMLQPELKKIQEKHRGGDRQAMNAEMMAFYQENQLNPLGGCLPLIVQAPVFIVLYNVIRGLTRITDGSFDPRYLGDTSELYQALHSEMPAEMVSFGLDLSDSASKAMGESIVHGLPYLALVLLMVGAQYLQQKQVSARNPDGSAAMPQQQILLKVMPVFFGVISLNFPAALVVYWVTSNIFRIGLQYYITRSLYTGEDSVGAQANAAAARARAMNNDGKGGSGKKVIEGKASEDTKGRGSKDNGAKNGGKGGSGPAAPVQSSRTSGGGGHPRSNKKRKRR